MNYRIFIFYGLILCGFFLFSCSENPTGNLSNNLPPDTKVAIFPDSGVTISPQQSKLRVHWWGDDPDGFILAYKFSWDGVKWDTTKRNDSVFTLKIQGLDTHYIFRVAAIDNFGLSDPTPAVFNYPIINSPPVIKFPLNYTIPESTFTVASFQWEITDVEGEETVDKIYVSLNDPNNFVEIPGDIRFITLTAQPPYLSNTVDAKVISGLSNPALTQYVIPNLKLNADNRIYIKARDLAGSFSKVITLPDTGRKWYVKKPKGNLLIVKDHLTNDNTTLAYLGIFDSLSNGTVSFKDKYDLWDIKIGKTTITSGIYLPRTIKPTFTETLKLFKYVFWFSADYDPSLNIFELCLNDYLKAGGKMLISMNPADKNSFDVNVLKNFLPVDSINITVPSIIPRGTSLNLTAFSQQANYPLLAIDNQVSPIARVLGYYPNELSTRSLYTIGVTGNPIVGFKTVDSKLIYIGLPLNRCNGGLGKLPDFFRKVFFDEFGATP